MHDSPSLTSVRQALWFLQARSIYSTNIHYKRKNWDNNHFPALSPNYVADYRWFERAHKFLSYILFHAPLLHKKKPPLYDTGIYLVGRPLDTSLYQQGFQPLRQNLLVKFRTVEQHGEGVKTKPLTINYYTHTLRKMQLTCQVSSVSWVFSQLYTGPRECPFCLDFSKDDLELGPRETCGRRNNRCCSTSYLNFRCLTASLGCHLVGPTPLSLNCYIFHRAFRRYRLQLRR